jgi:hypothetical protein
LNTRGHSRVLQEAILTHLALRVNRDIWC